MFFQGKKLQLFVVRPKEGTWVHLYFGFSPLFLIDIFQFEYFGFEKLSG